MISNKIRQKKKQDDSASFCMKCRKKESSFCFFFSREKEDVIYSSGAGVAASGVDVAPSGVGEGRPFTSDSRVGMLASSMYS